MARLDGVNGSLTVQIVSASPPDMLTAAANAGIRMQNVQELDPLTVRARICTEQYQQLERLLNKRGETCKRIHKIGLYWKVGSLIRRPVLFWGILLLLAASLFLPTRVLFVQVEGNVNVSTYEILEKAEACGIHMWASRTDVRSEKMKNSLLFSIPQLKWAGINTKGCTAVITVAERETQGEKPAQITPQSIVAARDGVISKLTVTKGTAVCKEGQAVTAGQILVSPYNDCGISVKVTDVEGEILAVTSRKVSAKTMDPTAVKGACTTKIMSLSILIGKNKIKLYKGSGNCYGICDKIYKENYMTLPGGFRLPIAIVTETTVYRECITDSSRQQNRSDVWSLTREYLSQDMVSGRILTQTGTVVPIAGGQVLEGNFSCLEMIGKLQDEETVPNEQRG